MTLVFPSLHLAHTRRCMKCIFPLTYLDDSALTSRSCDLDEWTADQLHIMKMSGNGNANLFFKRHGITELQSKSEKKYSTKAAQEYKKHLQRSLLDNAGADRKESMDSQDDKDNSGEWGAEKGLDNLIKSVSGEALSEKEGVTGGEKPTSTVFTNIQARAAPASTAAAAAPPAVILNKTPSNPDIGTISVALEGSSLSGAVKKGPIKVGTLGRGPKKMGAKKIGARKLTTGSIEDTSLESFEKVEERTEAVTQEVEDHKLAMKIQSTENQGAAGSSRLAAVYADAESVYTTPAPTNSYSQGNSSAYGSSSNTSGSNMTTSGGNPSSYSHVGSGDAVERFGKGAKSISSDAYFERNKVDVREMQSRLDKYRGASSISSDMLSGNEEAAARARVDSDDGLAVLKDSVKDFFSQIG